MARGWGNAPPDLKGTLGTLLRTTLIQLGSLRDVAVRELRSGGRELSARAPGLLRSRRTEVLAALGEIIYELARSGELDLDDFPELAGAIAELQTIDADVGDWSSSDAWSDDPAIAEAMEPASDTLKVWRPNPDDYETDGTLKAASAASEASPAPAAADNPPLDAAPLSRPTRRGGHGHIAFVPDNSGAGLDDEDDLAEYMHEDDVPSRD